MKTKSISYCLYIIFIAFILPGCNKDLLKQTNEDFKVKAFISNIKSYNVNADYNESIIPADTTSREMPYVSVQSWVIKGKDILMSITVPDDAEEIYFGANNSTAEYMGLNFSGLNQNTSTGYYRLQVKSISNPSAATNGLMNYQVVLSSNEKIQIDKFDLAVSYKTANGLSNKASIPMDVIGIAPYQKNLKVGFKPLSGYTYTINITSPAGSQIIYSYNKSTGTENFNNSQIPGATLSYDSDLGFKWIDFPDPQFGGYTMTATIQIDITGSSQYIYLYLAIITEGKIDQIDLNANIQQTGQNSAVGTANVGFSYFEELSAKVKMTVYRQQTQYFNDAVVPENQKITPGVGIRLNGNSDNKNLIKVVLEVEPVKPPYGVKYILRRNNHNINVWGSFNWTELILYANDQAEINFSSNKKEIWIENTTAGSSNLEFVALKGNDILFSDKITFNTFKSVVITFGGELNPSPLNVTTQGIWNLADDLYKNAGYDIYKFSENDCHDLASPSASYILILEAVNKRKVDNVAILGYSHGGGSTYLLAQRLLNNLEFNKDIAFTTYIDAVEQPGFNPIPEVRIPCRSKVHLNYYQQNVLSPSFMGDKWNGIKCGSLNPYVAENNVTNWEPGMNHDKIHKNPIILAQIKSYLLAWVKPR